MKSLANQITSWLIIGQNINTDKAEVTSYALEAILSTSVNLSIAFVIAKLTTSIPILLTFIFIFLPIRCMHKSYHCNSFIGCVCTTNCVFFISCTLLQNALIPTSIFLIIGLLLVNYFLAIEHNVWLNIAILVGYICFINVSEIIIQTITLSIFINIILITGGKLKCKLGNS